MGGKEELQMNDLQAMSAALINRIREIYQNKSSDEYKCAGDITKSDQYDKMKELVTGLYDLKGYKKSDADVMQEAFDTLHLPIFRKMVTEFMNEPNDRNTIYTALYTVGFRTLLGELARTYACSVATDKGIEYDESKIDPNITMISFLRAYNRKKFEESIEKGLKDMKKTPVTESYKFTSIDSYYSEYDADGFPIGDELVNESSLTYFDLVFGDIVQESVKDELKKVAATIAAGTIIVGAAGGTKAAIDSNKMYKGIDSSYSQTVDPKSPQAPKEKIDTIDGNVKIKHISDDEYQMTWYIGGTPSYMGIRRIRFRLPMKYHHYAAEFEAIPVQKGQGNKFDDALKKLKRGDKVVVTFKLNNVEDRDKKVETVVKIGSEEFVWYYDSYGYHYMQLKETFDQTVMDLIQGFKKEIANDVDYYTEESANIVSDDTLDALFTGADFTQESTTDVVEGAATEEVETVLEAVDVEEALIKEGPTQGTQKDLERLEKILLENDAKHLQEIIEKTEDKKRKSLLTKLLKLKESLKPEKEKHVTESYVQEGSFAKAIENTIVKAVTGLVNTFKITLTNFKELNPISMISSLLTRSYDRKVKKFEDAAEMYIETKKAYEDFMKLPAEKRARAVEHQYKKNIEKYNAKMQDAYAEIAHYDQRSQDEGMKEVQKYMDMNVPSVPDVTTTPSTTSSTSDDSDDFGF